MSKPHKFELSRLAGILLSLSLKVGSLILCYTFYLSYELDVGPIGITFQLWGAL